MSEVAAGSRGPSTRFGRWIFVTGLVAVDLWTKGAALGYLTLSQGVYGAAQPIEVFDTGFCTVRMMRAYNSGIAAGLLAGSPVFMIAVRALAAGGLLWLLHRSAQQARLQTAALGALLAGALGNLADNVWTFDPSHPRAVRDFLHIGCGAWNSPAFNVADVYVAAGAAMLLWVITRRRRAGARP